MSIPANNADSVRSGRLSRLLSALYRNWLFLLFLILVPCCAILRSTDYVTADADLRLSDATAAVTANSPVTMSIRPTSRNLRSILFQICPPDAPSDASEEDSTVYLEIIVADASGNELTRTVLQNSEDAGAAALDGTCTEVTLPSSDGTGASTENLTVTFCSDAPSEAEAFHLAISEDGSIWHRCTYLFLSNSRRILLETAAGWGILVLLYVLLVQKRKTNASASVNMHLERNLNTKCSLCLGRYSHPKRSPRPERHSHSKHSLHPEHFFLIASIVLGILYFLILPCMLVPDASNHFVRSYLLTKGMLLLPEGGQVTIPVNLLPFESYTYTPYILAHNLRGAIDWSRTVSYDAVNMALYSPINYLVQAFGIAIGGLFSQNANFLQVFGSVVNYAACTALLYWSIRKIPYGKEALTVLSLLPMAIQERASLSADSITYACVVAMIAFCLELRSSKEPMSRRDYVVMYLLLIAVASCKIVYFVTGFMILLIPNRRFRKMMKTDSGDLRHDSENSRRDGEDSRHDGENARHEEGEVADSRREQNGTANDCSWKRRAIAAKLSGCAVLLLFSLGWLILASGYLGSTRGGGDTSAKVSLILHQPVRYLYILNKTIMNDGVSYMFEMVGSKMGATNIEISSLVIFLALLILVTAVCWDLHAGNRADFTGNSPVHSVKNTKKSGDMKVPLLERQDVLEEQETLEEQVILEQRVTVPDASSILGSLFMLLLSLAMILLVMTSLYIQWTSLDAATYSIEGLQGRYFLPIAPLALMAVIGVKEERLAQKEVLEQSVGSPAAETHFGKLVFAISCINVLVLIFCWSHGSYIG